MVILLIILAVVLVFIVTVISPHLGDKIQKDTDRETHWLKRLSNWLWNPLTWWAKKSLEFTRESIVKAAAWGKKTRRKT